MEKNYRKPRFPTVTTKQDSVVAIQFWLIRSLLNVMQVIHKLSSHYFIIWPFHETWPLGSMQTLMTHTEDELK